MDLKTFFARSRSSWLARRFAPRLRVTLCTDHVEFRTDSNVVVLRPVLWTRGTSIVAIGTPPPEAAEGLPVLVPDPQERLKRLGKLFVYGFRAVLQAPLAARPVVSLALESNAVSFAEARAALEAAGAAAVQPVEHR